MWSVVLLDRSGSILEVLADSEPVLSGALAFAAGYGNSSRGVVAVLPSESAVVVPSSPEPEPIAESGAERLAGSIARSQESRRECKNSLVAVQRCIDAAEHVASVDRTWRLIGVDLLTKRIFQLDSELSTSEAWIQWKARSESKQGVVVVPWPSDLAALELSVLDVVDSVSESQAEERTWNIIGVDTLTMQCYELDSGLTTHQAWLWCRTWNPSNRGVVAVPWPCDLAALELSVLDAEDGLPRMILQA